MNQDGTQTPNNLELPDVKPESSNSGGVVNNEDRKAPTTAMPAITTQATDSDDKSITLNDRSNTASLENQTGVASSSSVSSTTNSPMIADDVDLIEKEWVEKAKEIVNKTKDNPYLQNKAISEIKTDYIKKRYNKDLSKSE
ncbi:MAG: hypothetical protein H6793_00950 [Candidatus Nomurabacteria bacterium]|nr:hypothetical protein [Candidatus Saccharibacteria bacterium]USN95718.1 MAG: hypothetical protein H6793_00950 [Candidatus Nomurabacteria bacterium]